MPSPASEAGICSTCWPSPTSSGWGCCKRRASIDLVDRPVQGRRLIDALADSSDIPTLAHVATWRALLRLATDDEQLLLRHVAEQIADELD